MSEMRPKTKITAFCPDCGASIGMPHRENCDVARCLTCGGQAFSCGCEDTGQDTWTGYWPGILEAEEYGFWCKFTPRGWVTCDENDPDARTDLTRLVETCVWDKTEKRFIPRT